MKSGVRLVRPRKFSQNPFLLSVFPTARSLNESRVMSSPQKNRNTWQGFEELVEKIHRAFHPKATVKRGRQNRRESFKVGNPDQTAEQNRSTTFQEMFKEHPAFTLP